MAQHFTCDGCGVPVDGQTRKQDEMLARVTVARGPQILAYMEDLCAVCTESICRAVVALRDRPKAPPRG